MIEILLLVSFASCSALRLPHEQQLTDTMVQIVKENVQMAKVDEPSKPKVGICISGLIRTFPVPEVHDRLLANLMEPLKKSGYELSVFFNLRKDDDPRGATRKVTFDSNSTNSAIEKFHPTSTSIVDTDAAVPENKACHQDCFSEKSFKRWYFPWARVQGCYEMMTNAEESNGKFDHMIKIRSDNFLFSPIDAKEFLEADAVVVPRGLTDMGNDAINDWFAACPRHLCEAYFQVAQMWQTCSGSFKKQNGCGNSEHMLMQQMNKKAAGHVKQKLIFMTIMPTCDSVACIRIAKHCPSDQRTCAEARAKCEKESENASCDHNADRYKEFSHQTEQLFTKQLYETKMQLAK